MKLAAYREFRPIEESTPRMRQLYGKMGITESFLRDVEYSSVSEAAWAFMARRIAGKAFAHKLKDSLSDGIRDAMIEERAKKIRRIMEKLSRPNRSPGLEASPLLKALESMGLPYPIHSVGSIRDMYGVRVIIPSVEGSRDRCYGILEKALEVGGVKDVTGILSLVDYLAYSERRYDSNDNYLGRYESLQVSFIYLGVPIEVQIRDSEMDWNAKHLVKRAGLDK